MLKPLFHKYLRSVFLHRGWNESNYAVLSEDGSETVFVIKDSTAIRQTVETGYSNDFYFEIISGLSPGDQVVVVGQNV